MERRYLPPPQVSKHTPRFHCASIGERVQGAQIRAALAVNRELVLLYWGIGMEILARQQEEGWGTKVIERLARDLLFSVPVR